MHLWGVQIIYGNLIVFIYCCEFLLTSVNRYQHDLVDVVLQMIPLQTIVIVILILVELQIIIVQIIGLVECKQCLLFARIFEIERIVEGGFSGWCLMVIANGFLSIFVCLLIVTRRPILGIHVRSLTQGEKMWMLFCVTLSEIVTTCFVTFGWHQFCSSFKVARCHLTSSLLIDWKSYTPKYSNCYNTYYYYTINEMGLWWCSASWIYLLLTTYRRNLN